LIQGSNNALTNVIPIHCPALHFITAIQGFITTDFHQDIRPAIPHDLAILASISWQCGQISQTSHSLTVITDNRIEKGIKQGQISVEYRNPIYSVVQVSLNNVLKYSYPSRVWAWP
jgi:signal transduction histidine kinase